MVSLLTVAGFSVCGWVCLLFCFVWLCTVFVVCGFLHFVLLYSAVFGSLG